MLSRGSLRLVATHCSSESYGEGGAISFKGNGVMYINATQFMFNTASVYGSALSLSLSGVARSIIVDSCSFIMNQSPQDGGILLYSSTSYQGLYLSSLSFAGNSTLRLNSSAALAASLPSGMPAFSGFCTPASSNAQTLRNSFIVWTVISPNDQITCVNCTYDANCANLISTGPVSIGSFFLPPLLTLSSGSLITLPSKSKLCLLDLYDNITAYDSFVFSLNVSLIDLGPIIPTSQHAFLGVNGEVSQNGYLMVQPIDGCFDFNKLFSVNGVPGNLFMINVNASLGQKYFFNNTASFNSFLIQLESCQLGYYRTDLGCVLCPQDSINTVSDATKCQSCGPALVSDETRTKCTCPNCLTSAASSGILTASAIIAALCLIVLIVVVRYRNQAVIKAGANLFLWIILVGLIVVCLGTSVRTLLNSQYDFSPENFDMLCFLEPTSIAVGFCLVFGSLICKTFRVWKIFSSDMHELRRGILVKDKQLMCGLTVYLTLNVLVLVTWGLVDFPRLTMHREWRTCRGHSQNYTVFTAVLVFMDFVVLCFGLFLSIVTRKVTEQFNESRLIATCIYSILFGGIIQVVLVAVDPLLPIIPDLIIQLNVLTVLGILFGPKLITLNKNIPGGLFLNFFCFWKFSAEKPEAKQVSLSNFYEMQGSGTPTTFRPNGPQGALGMPLLELNSPKG